MTSKRNKGNSNSRRRRGGNANAAKKDVLYPVVIYGALTPAAPDTIMTKNFKINDFLSDNTYSYRLQSLSIDLRSPAVVTNGAGAFTSVGSCVAQVYGYMQQDSSLQRIPLTTWRSLSTTNSTIFSFSKNILHKRIYAGGFVPITNVNSDDMFGVHAIWQSGSVLNGTADLKMNLTVRIRAQFVYYQDLQIGEITNVDRELELPVSHTPLMVQKESTGWIQIPPSVIKN
jgi:hypothetical protein